MLSNGVRYYTGIKDSAPSIAFFTKCSHAECRICDNFSDKFLKIFFFRKKISKRLYFFGSFVPKSLGSVNIKESQWDIQTECQNIRRGLDSPLINSVLLKRMLVLLFMFSH